MTTASFEDETAVDPQQRPCWSFQSFSIW